MTPRPIAITAPQLGELLAGRLTVLRRPWGVNTARLAPGDRLWVREPFHLAAKWNGLSPTSADRLGAQPVFTEAIPTHGCAELGRRRFARELLRVWHRQHLVLRGIERHRLQAITQAEIEAEGFTTRAAYIAAWDRNLAVSSAATNRWAENPLVAVLRFTRIAAPLPELAE